MHNGLSYSFFNTKFAFHYPRQQNLGWWYFAHGQQSIRLIYKRAGERWIYRPHRNKTYKSNNLVYMTIDDSDGNDHQRSLIRELT